MPYVASSQRLRLDMEYGDTLPVRPGDLNYLVTKLCVDYANLKVEGGYATYNEIVGVLECAKLEFYRRAVAAYEDEKIKENGDVY